MRYTVAILAALAAVGCTTPVENTTTQARLRNDPPATCSEAQMKACPAPAVEVCADGSEPVLDYASDCCAYFSCQKICQSAVVCEKTPAPACPAGTKLWVGTATDCCPAYRCNPDESSGCGGKQVACALALPYCGPGVDPVEVGKTPDCCPIYQCPCLKSEDPTKPVDANCGCTYPICKPGEEMVCKGANVCGYPCECFPAHGMCTADFDCSADARCDLSSCLLPPTYPVDAGPAQCAPEKCGPMPMMPNVLCGDGKLMAGPTGRCLVNPDGSCGWEIARCPVPMDCPVEKCGPALGMPSQLCPDGKNSAGPTGRCLLVEAEGRCVWEIAQCPPPACDPTECGPELMMPNLLCQDGKALAGPSGRCLRHADGKCGWEILECPPTTGCFGVCVPNVQKGCKADMECPTGQRCELSCMGWGCAGTPDGTTACACDLNDPSCYCDPTTGSCKGQTCEGRCVPVGPVCDKVDPAACPAIAPVCDNGAQPVAVGNDPVSCCPIFECPKCASGQPVACPMPAIDCACVISKDIDPTTCCPVYQCGKLDPTTGKCL
ncbi:MAG TPA: hypothetical protein VGK67_36090 [Myxococcales bacterium]|jgi:hypothetical protein